MVELSTEVVVRFSLAVIHYFGYYHPPWIPNEQSTMLPHLNRHNKEQKTMETKTWLEQTMADRPSYSFLHHQKLDKFVRTSSKWLAMCVTARIKCLHH
jgi:hypothetical protein